MTWEESITEIPAGRLSRLKVAGLETDRLAQFFAMAIRYRHYPSHSPYRPRTAATGERIGHDAPGSHSPHDGPCRPATQRRQLTHLQDAESAVVKLGESAAGYLLEELSLRLHSGEFDEARMGVILKTLTTRYAKEPGILDQLRLILNRFGLMRPDGRVGLPSAAAKVEAATSRIVTDVHAATPVEPRSRGQRHRTGRTLQAMATGSRLSHPSEDECWMDRALQLAQHGRGIRRAQSHGWLCPGPRRSDRRRRLARRVRCTARRNRGIPGCRRAGVRGVALCHAGTLLPSR